MSNNVSLKQYYKETVVKQLQQQFSYKNIMQVPSIAKITLNMGVGEGVNDRKLVTQAVEELSLIAGQKAVINNAKKSIHNVLKKIKIKGETLKQKREKRKKKKKKKKNEKRKQEKRKKKRK